MLRRKLILFLLTATLVLGVKTPRPLADVLISTPDGKKIDLKQYRGKVIMLALISTTCADCISSVDLMNKMQQQFGPRGFVPIGVAVGLDAETNTKGFLDPSRPAYPRGYVLEGPFRQLAYTGPRDLPHVPMCLFLD